jgi:hypothetical protein
MAITTVGDILLNAKPYLVERKTYRVSESRTSYPRTTTGNQPEERHGDNWSYWVQSDWIGDSQDDWLADGPYSVGYGLDLSVAGQITVAKQLAQTKADTANTGGYVAFSDGTSKIWFCGKTDGKSYYSSDGTNWTLMAPGDATYWAANRKPVSSTLYAGQWHVGLDNGQVWKLAAGAATWTLATTIGATNAYLLGSYKGKLYVGTSNALYTWDGASATQLFSGNIDGTPSIGAIGNSLLYMFTIGPESKLLMTDSNQLVQIATMPNDFLPKACVYIETLIVVGSLTDDTNTIGQVWRLEKSGLTPIYEFGDSTADYGIRSAYSFGSMIYWGANQKTGLGIYDPRLDIFQDAQMGFYVSSVITSLTNVVHGITQFANVVYCGIEAKGVYKQTTPGTFLLTSSMFDGNTKNINKLWGRAEIKHSALVAGQNVTLKTLKDGVTKDTWGTNSTVGTVSYIVAGPANYKNPYLQYDISGDANGSALSILDISLAHIEVSDNPKREWDIVFTLEGGDGGQFQIMRDGSSNTRSAQTMLSELNALWNTKTTFDDLDGTQYNVIIKVPQASVNDVIKEVQGGAIVDALIFYRVHLTQL